MLILPSVLIIFIEPLILFVYVVLYNKFNHLNKNIIPYVIIVDTLTLLLYLYIILRKDYLNYLS